MSMRFIHRSLPLALGYACLLLKYIPSYEYTTIYLSIPSVTDIWVFPIFSYYECSYYKHSCTDTSLDTRTHFSRLIPES